MLATIRRVSVSCLAVVCAGLLFGALGCGGNEKIEKSLQNMRKPAEPLPGEEPYQTAIRSYLIKNLREPEFEIIKWHPPVPSRRGTVVTLEFYEKLPNETTKVPRKRLFIYSKKGEVSAISETN